MKRFIYIILLFFLLSLSSCKLEPKSKEKFFEEIDQTTTKLQDGTISFSWRIIQNSDEFWYFYTINHTQNKLKIHIINEVKDKTKYYSNEYVFENNKIMKTHKYYLKDELVEERAEETDKTEEDFNKLRILEFHEFHFNLDDVETYFCRVEYGMPKRYYSDILFKEVFYYTNINGYCDVVLSNIKLSYLRDSNSHYDMVGINSAGQEVKIQILI